MAHVWRCERCRKVKDLSGPHLDGKATVRSDCWPCAKKTTFFRDDAVASAKECTAATTASATPLTSHGRAVPSSLSAAPVNEAQVTAFQNIFAAAAAAAAAVKRTTSPAANAFSATSREGSRGGTTATTTTTTTTTTAAAAAPAHRTNSSSSGSASFSSPHSPANPFLAPAVSAASIRRFQTSYASVMATKHDDPTAAAAAITTVTSSVVVASGESEGSKTPSTASPYVMEPAAGTSPPFTFRPNANYISSTTATGANVWSTVGLLPGSTAAMASAAPAAAHATTRAPSASSATSARTNSPSPSFSDSTRGGMVSAAAAGGGAAAASLTGSLRESALEWVCQHCGKAKDLKGDHLRGKTSVRSDCWPCAKKRTFLLTTPKAHGPAAAAAVLAAKLSSKPSGGGALSQRAGNVASGSSSRVASSAPPSSVFVNPFLAPQGAPRPPPPLPQQQQQHQTAFATATADTVVSRVGVPPPTRLSWVSPAIPADTPAEEPLLLHTATATPTAVVNLLPSFGSPAAAAAATTERGTEVSGGHGRSISSGGDVGGAAELSPSWIVAAAGSAATSEADRATHYAALARFDQQLLATFRERLVAGVQLRAVWWERVLYVIAEDAPPEVLAAGAPLAGYGTQTPYDVVRAFAALGRYAALYLAIEQKLAASRFRHVGRLFCPNEFALAAACCYANNFFHGDRTAAAAAPSSTACTFRVYGPQTDPTTALSLWGRIVSESPTAQLCTVSEEQRVVAAQMLYRRVSWLAAPHTMNGTAMQLSVEGNEPAADDHGVDVVLLTGTMKLEELPQAVPLAQLAQPYT